MVRQPPSSGTTLFNREGSRLNVDWHVLEEAGNLRNPLLERVNFLAISASYLDDFFEVCAGRLLHSHKVDRRSMRPDGFTVLEERELIKAATREFVEKQHSAWNECLRPELAKQGVGVLGIDELRGRTLAFVDGYCARELDPLLTPVAVDPAHPFPRVISKALCVALLLRRRRSSRTLIGVITVPRVLPRLIRLPSQGTIDFIFLADLVLHYATRMFKGYDILSSAAFRVTRNSNLYLQGDDSRNLPSVLKLRNRRNGDVVRMEIGSAADPEIIARLGTLLELDQGQIFAVQGPVNLSWLFNIYNETARPDLKYRTDVPHALHRAKKFLGPFEELQRHDVPLHHSCTTADSVERSRSKRRICS